VGVGWGGGGGWQLRLPFRHNGTSCVPKELPHGSQTIIRPLGNSHG